MLKYSYSRYESSIINTQYRIPLLDRINVCLGKQKKHANNWYVKYDYHNKD